MTTQSIAPDCNFASTGFCAMVATPTTLTTTLDTTNCQLEISVNAFAGRRATVLLRALVFGTRSRCSCRCAARGADRDARDHLGVVLTEPAARRRFAWLLGARGHAQRATVLGGAKGLRGCRRCGCASNDGASAAVPADHLRTATSRTSRIGELALLLLAATHDGVDAADPTFAAAAKRLAKANANDTYDLALRLMVLEVVPTVPGRF
ncbi:MAG: hypothetical protein ABIP94_10235 [Planctomycetota bacterium]